MSETAKAAPIPDRIEKHIVLRAPLARVWEAISDSRRFGAWFGVAFDDPFVAGAPARGHVVPTTVDAQVAARQEAYRGMAFEIVVDRIEAMRLFSFRWHPFAIEPGVDYSGEPMTLVAFALEPVAGGTSLTISETGFSTIPLERRLRAFPANEQGWAAQIGQIARYVERDD